MGPDVSLTLSMLIYQASSLSRSTGLGKGKKIENQELQFDVQPCSSTTDGDQPSWLGL